MLMNNDKTKQDDDNIMHVIRYEESDALFARAGYPLNEALYNMKSNVGAELINYARTKENITCLAQGESCQSTPGFIIDAATKALARGETFYGRPLGLPALRDEISAYYQRIYDLNISPERVFITTSGSNAMNLSLRAILNPGDEVVAITPIWKNLLGAVELSGSVVRQVPLEEREDGWRLDLDCLYAACNENTRAILVVSPSNPTGWVAKTEEVKAIQKFARDKGIWVISDEVYNRLTYDTPRAPSFLDTAEEDDLLLTINSFSKAWAMTGWRLGWITGPEFMSDKIRHLAIYNNLCVAPFVQYGGIVALQDGEEFIKNQLVAWQKGRDLVIDTLQNQEKIHIHRPESSFYAFFRVDGEEDSVKFAYKLIDEVGLSLAPGATFGSCCQPYMRLSFACSREKIEKALNKLCRFL